MALLSGMRIEGSRLILMTIKREINRQSGHLKQILHSNHLEQKRHVLHAGQSHLLSYISSSHPVQQNGHSRHIPYSLFSGQTRLFRYVGKNGLFSYNQRSDPMGQSHLQHISKYWGYNGDVIVDAIVRLKREDYTHTKHDTAFSYWKLLVEHSLPTNCPAVYEIGIMICSGSSRGARKIDPSCVFPVYVGMTKDVRARLQQYGRDGAHLEEFFKEASSLGFSIVFRYARMESQKDAKVTEAQLLDTFDYAWNKVRNDDRRNIFDKPFNRSSSETSFFSNLYGKLLSQKKVGIEIKTCEPISYKKVSNEPNRNTMSPRTFGMKRFYPLRQPFPEIKSDKEYDICGVLIGDGLTCTKQPVKGRKRCAKHKRMRVNSHVSQLSVDEKSAPIYGLNAGGKLPRICGFVMEDGSPCINNPLNRN